MTATLKKNLIGLVISVLLFAAGVFLVIWLYSDNKHVSVEEAQVTITDITLNEDYRALVKWDCYNTDATSYQVFSIGNNGNKNYLYSTILTRRFYLGQTSRGGFFTYAVRAHNSEEDEAMSSELSPYVSIFVDPEEEIGNITEFMPELKYEYDNGKIRLNWNRPVNCAITSCCLYRKNADNKWEVVVVTAPYVTAYTDDCSEGEYKLVIRGKVNGKTVNSLESNILFAEVQHE